MKNKANQLKVMLVWLITGLGIGAIFFIGTVSQDPAFHHFADARQIGFVPNGWNVLSNIPFLLVGGWGILSLAKRRVFGILHQLYPAYIVFFAGIFLTGIGSTYYHLAPDNATLVWDRLPMTIAFMAFFAIILSETINVKTGRKALPVLVLVGMATIIYWHFKADLRPYVLVQFLPMILTPVLLLLFSTGFNTNRYTWLMLLAYIIAKVCEHFDLFIYEKLLIAGGHAIKHLFAAIAPLLFLIGIKVRKLKYQ